MQTHLTSLCLCPCIQIYTPRPTGVRIHDILYLAKLKKYFTNLPISLKLARGSFLFSPFRGAQVTGPGRYLPIGSTRLKPLSDSQAAYHRFHRLGADLREAAAAAVDASVVDPEK